jgi:hypothetical protein
VEKKLQAVQSPLNLGLVRTGTITNPPQICPFEQARNWSTFPKLHLVGASALWENACL